MTNRNPPALGEEQKVYAHIRAKFVASKLGKAQRRVILSLTDDWGKAVCHQTARRMFYGVTSHRFTVVHHKHRTDNCWRLSDLGRVVKDVLLAEAAQ